MLNPIFFVVKKTTAPYQRPINVLYTCYKRAVRQYKTLIPIANNLAERVFAEFPAKSVEFHAESAEEL